MRTTSQHNKHAQRLLIISAVIAILLVPASLFAQQVHITSAQLTATDIRVSATLTLDAQRTEEIKRGVSKEIIFYVDLFRQWERWPDEFITGKTITETLKCDPVNKENLLVIDTGGSSTKKRFADCDKLLEAAMSIKDLQLSKTQELEPANYYVRVGVESRLMRLPPFIDLLFFFVKETEFEVSEESAPFELKQANETAK